jgi:hypothetical protein
MNMGTSARLMKHPLKRAVCAFALVSMGMIPARTLGQSVPGVVSTAPVPGDPRTPGIDNGSTLIQGNVNTPFPTNVGIAGSVTVGVPAVSTINHRMARTQYLFRAEELTAMGLMPGPITAVTFEALFSDRGDVFESILCTTTAGSTAVTSFEPNGLEDGTFIVVTGPTLALSTGVTQVADSFNFTLSQPAIADGVSVINSYRPYPLVDSWLACEIRLGHATDPLLNGPDASFTGTQWDDGIQAQAPNTIVELLYVEKGLLPIPLTTPFGWNGTDNVLLDVYWLRNATTGFSPGVRLVTDLSFAATRQALPMNPVGVGLPNVAAQAPPLDDNDTCTDCVAGPPNLSVYMRNSNTRPVVLFAGQRRNALQPCFSQVVSSISGLDPSYTVSDLPVQLVGTPSGGFFTGPGVSGSTFDPAAAGVGQHSISYSFADSAGCISAAAQCTEVNLNVGLGGAEALAGGVRVFPNPNSGHFSVELELEGLVSVQVFDAAGRIVHQEVFRSTGGRTTRPLDLTRSAKGSYTLQVQHAGDSVTLPVVIN